MTNTAVLARTRSVALVGADAHLVDVEVHTAVGLPLVRIVGLPTASVREAEQRVRASIEHSGYKWDNVKLTANLAPAGLRKDGTHFDLALAVGVLGCRKKIPAPKLDGWVLMGELALDGRIRGVRGVLAAAIACRKLGLRLICPAQNVAEALAVEGLEVVPVSTLRECVSFLRREIPAPVPALPEARTSPAQGPDMRDVRGQGFAKRALEIAAAGGHNVLLVGPPGGGKTMLARRLPGILPPISNAEALEVTKIHSVAGELDEGAGLVGERPFRWPHHNVSMAGLIGGGQGLARPGEVSLAHHGVLFLDELSLYRRDVLDALRGPVEDGIVRVARSGGCVHFPSRFSLIAATNPCPCGHRLASVRPCTCTALQLQNHRSRVSGPLLDRFDMQVEAERASREELLGTAPGEPSSAIRERVVLARERQSHRYGSSLVTNASVPRPRLDEHVTLDDSSRLLLGESIDNGLSGRGLDRTLRVARTIADLDDREVVTEEDLGEALFFRYSGVYREVTV